MFLLQLTQNYDWAAIVGALAILSGVLSTWAGVRLKKVEVKQQANKEVQAAKQNETETVIESYREMVRTYKEDNKDIKRHSYICEKQLDYLKTKLLKAGILEPEDLEFLLKFEHIDL